jgi:hypothetical protein
MAKGTLVDKREKHYVGVTCHTTAEGIVTPRSIDFDDGRRFEVQQVTECRRAHSFKVGGTGIRYTIFVNGSKTYLFYDDYRGRWFVEAKVRDGKAEAERKGTASR